MGHTEKTSTYKENEQLVDIGRKVEEENKCADCTINKASENLNSLDNNQKLTPENIIGRVDHYSFHPKYMIYQQLYQPSLKNYDLKKSFCTLR